MTTLSSATRDTFHTQHTLQSQDILLICQLADAESNVEDTLEQIQSWSFEQFFGFTCHLFITTESSKLRNQLATLFPKFGNIAILSLIKIVYYFDLRERNQPSSDPYFSTEVQALARKVLEDMPTPTLAIGLAQIIEADTHSALSQTIAAFLAKVFYKKEEDILSLLSRHLSKDSWHAIEASLIRELSSPQPEKVVSGRFNTIHTSPACALLPVPQLTEVA